MLWDKSNDSRLLVDSCYTGRLAKPSRVCSWGPGTVCDTECRPLVRLMYAMVFPPPAQVMCGMTPSLETAWVEFDRPDVLEAVCLPGLLR